MAFRGGYRFKHFSGAARPSLFELPVPGQVLFPPGHPLLGRYKPAVESGTTVRAGETLLTDGGIGTLPAPIGGTVELTGDGALGIRGDGSAGFEPVGGHTRDPRHLDREDLFALFLRTGAGILFANRFGTREDCDAVTVIIVNTVHTSPLARDWSPDLFGDRELVPDGIGILRALFPRADITITATRRNEKSLATLAGELARIAVLSDRYPQEHPSLLARDAVSGGDEPTEPEKAAAPLIVDLNDVVRMTEVLSRGRPLIDRIVCLAGPGISRPGWYRIRIGTSVADILAQAGKADSYGPWRAILGNPLTGRGIESPGEPLLYGDTELSVISEHAVRDLFAFLDPGFTSDSYCRATVSSILPLFPRKIETNVHGGVRPCVQCNFCDEVCPAGIYPFLIWKYATIGKDEEAFRLRPDACIECGLCDYVCPSKISLLDGIRQVKQSLTTAGEAHAAAD